MSNHPNMSYCMWQNTVQALQQVAADFAERCEDARYRADVDDAETDAPQPLSDDELRAMRYCFALMRDMQQQAGIEDDCNDVEQAAVDAISTENTQD